MPSHHHFLVCLFLPASLHGCKITAKCFSRCSVPSATAGLQVVEYLSEGLRLPEMANKSSQPPPQDILVDLKISLTLTPPVISHEKAPCFLSIPEGYVGVRLKQIPSYMPQEGYKYGRSSARYVRVDVQRLADSSICAAQR